MFSPWARDFIRIASVDSAVKWVPGGDNLVKGVQCYELFGGIALKIHTFSFHFYSIDVSDLYSIVDSDLYSIVDSDLYFDVTFLSSQFFSVALQWIILLMVYCQHLWWYK